MSTNPLHQLEFTSRVRKRAQYEAFEFTVTDDGVLVRNGSHANPENHEYLVTLAEGVPATCTCPANANYPGACKHRVAVAIRTPVLQAALGKQVAADGGRPKHGDASGETVTDSADSPEKSSGDEYESPDDTDCECESLPGSFPCWECVRTGRRTLEEDERA